MTMREKMRSMNRESHNGYEVCFMMHHLTATNWRWELARYPLDIRNTEPTETVLSFEGHFDWADAIAAAEKYLNEHPDDGFGD